MISTQTKLFLKTFVPYFVTVTKDFFRLWKGQNRDADILQTAHRLEKGLTLSSHRPMWGWDKAKRIVQLINGQQNTFSAMTGLSVLSAYISHKESAGEEEKITSLFANRPDRNLNLADYQCGGGILIKKEEVLIDDIKSFIDVVNARHSIREFDGTHVDKDKLIEAINLANRCPSACNRQPTKVYVIERETWNKYLKGCVVYGEDKHLLITASMTDFNVDEMHDWIVSGSIFAAYLTLSLTAQGIGSCVIRKPLYGEKSVAVYHTCFNIPKNEKVILEIAIGNYKDEFKVAYSNRKKSDDFTVWK